MSQAALGLIGVGDFARYLVAALRRAGDSRPIVLSPRGASAAAELAERWGARVMADNQAVADASELLLLCVRPPQAPSALAGLRFAARCEVASAMAGLSCADLVAMGVPAQRLSLVLPPPSVAAGCGPIALYPAREPWRALLAPIGAVMAFDDEDSYRLASVFACLEGSLYEWMQQPIDAAVALGLEPAAARAMMIETLRGAAARAAAHGGADLSAISAHIASEGSYTLRGLQWLRECGALRAWAAVFEALAAPLR